MALTTANDVEYFERPGYTESWTQGGIEISRTVVCSWPDRFRLKTDFLGTVAVVGKALSRTLPEFHPEANWLPCVSASLINPEGAVKQTDLVNRFGFFFNDGQGLNKNGYAVFRMTHASVPYLLFDDRSKVHEKQRFTFVREKVSGEAVQTPGGTWQVVGAPAPIMEPGSLPYFIKEINVHWYQVAGWDQASIEGLLNKVNANAWSIREYTYQAETLLFTGYDTEEKRSAAGQLIKDITFTMLWRPLGWNSFYRPKGPLAGQGPGWYEVRDVATGTKKPFTPDAAGFDGLFNVFAAFTF